MDASDNTETEALCNGEIPGLAARLVFRRALRIGAAPQRNEAVGHAGYPTLLFLDDDILLEPHCIHRLWNALASDEKFGGVSATITNQRYFPPGLPSRSLFRLLHGRVEASYAGKCIGPGLNLLPEDSDRLPEVVPVEWLNLGCTLYRAEALPSPVFEPSFIGYSMFEDLSLSLKVARKWKLANARTARIFHDSQSSEYKSNPTAMAKMELVNRHWIMTNVLGRTAARDYAKLALLETFGIVTPLTSLLAWKRLAYVLSGKVGALREIMRQPSGSPLGGMQHERKERTY